MATVQMKADYAASEVYSTASEPPPAYKRQANSVKIAKITAFTIIVSSFILGAFILASSYLQAKASCDQVQALDSVLEKELMLETLQQVNKELPRAEALLGKENSDEADLQNIDKDDTMKKTDYKPQDMMPTPPTIEFETNVVDSDDMKKFPGKVPLELDLSDLAATLLKNNKKSRMNCVVERKHAEEIVDSPSKTVALPFGVNLRTDPKKARITGERISIYCDGGDDSKEQDSRNNREEVEDDTDEDAEPIRPMFIPFQRFPIPFGRMPQQFPLTHMPQRMMPPVQMQQQQPQPQQMQHQIPQQPMLRQMPPLPPFHQLPLRPPMPPQVMQAPQPEQQSHNLIFSEPPQQQQQTVRIHVQQIPFREIHVADDVPVQIAPRYQVQHVPLGEALQRAGITQEDLRNIQRMAEERINDELKRWVPDADEYDDNSNSDETNDENSNENERESAARNSSEEQERQQSAEQQVQQQQLPQQSQLPPQMEQDSQQANQQDSQPDQQQQQSQEQEQQQPQQPQQRSEENQQTPMIQPPARLILQPLPEQPTQNQITPLGRVVFGRSLAQPVRIPVPMMQAQADASDASASNEESERPHILQPRSSSFN